MPELPDVEAIRRYLVTTGLPGHRFTGVTLHWPKAVREPSPEQFQKQLPDRMVHDVGRRGKFLLIHLDQGTLVVHLRMTGSLVMVSDSSWIHPMTRTVFHLDDGGRLLFVDGRKLGAMWLVEDTAPILSHLGPEPLEDAFTAEVLASQIEGRSVPIKPLLLEQQVVAGIGNIYADEILFLSGIHPMRKAKELSLAEVEAIHRATKNVLQEATDKLCRLMPIAGPPTESEEGTTVLRLPRKEGAPCPSCGTPTQRLVIRQRSAYFCPSCQR